MDCARALVVGNGLDDGVHMGPLVDAQQLATVLTYIEAGTHEGAQLVTGGRRIADGAFRARLLRRADRVRRRTA